MALFYKSRRIGAWATLFLIFLVSLSFAGGMAKTAYAMNSLSSGLTSILPIVGMLMTMLGAVIYASGQMMGAETRARTNVWATAALTGAMVSVLIAVIAPTVMTTIYGKPIAGVECQSDVPATGCPTGQTEIFYHAPPYNAAPEVCMLTCGIDCGSNIIAQYHFCQIVPPTPSACYFCIDK